MASHDSYLECFTCGKSFVHATTLREHEDYSCQARVLFVCIPCGLTFDSNWFLDQHLIRHKRRGSLLFSKEDYKCDRCKTPFISPFTLATHQLYSCPATCEFVQRNPPEGTTTYSEDEPGSSDDEGKLKIVENVFEKRLAFESRKSKFLNRKNSKSKKLVEKASNANKIQAALKQKNIENICKNNNIENKNKEEYSKISTVSFNKDNGSSFKANQRVKDLNATLNFGISNENGVSTSKVLKTTEKETELNNITKEKESYSSIELPGKELSVTQNSNTSNGSSKGHELSCSNKKTLQNEAKLSDNVQEEKVPLKVVLKIKDIAENAALPDKTNELNSAEKLSKVSTTNVIDNSQATIITTTKNSTMQEAISKAVVNTEEIVKVISNSCVNNDVFGKERGTENAAKVFNEKRRNFKPKTYPCRLCGRCFAYPETRSCHESVICYRNTTAKRHETYTCTKCDFVLKNSDEFDLHTIMKCCPKLKTFNTRVLSPVSCQYCARQFVQTTTLATHLKYCCTTQPNRRNLKEIITDPFEKKELVSCCNQRWSVL